MGSESRKTFFAYCIPAILTSVARADSTGTRNAVKDKSCQLLMSTLWLEHPEDNSVLIHDLIWCLVECAKDTPKDAVKNLLQACTETHAESYIATRAIKQIEVLFTPTPSSLSKWDMAEIYHRCGILEALTREPSNPVAAAVIEGGGDILLLKLFTVIVKRIPRGIMKRERALMVTSICLCLLDRFFKLGKFGILRKALRAGFLASFARLMPFYDGVKEILVNEIGRIITETIPGELTQPKSAFLLAGIIKQLAPADRKALSESILGQQWKDTEKLLIERLVFLKYDSKCGQFIGCDAVSSFDNGVRELTL